MALLCWRLQDGTERLASSLLATPRPSWHTVRRIRIGIPQLATLAIIDGEQGITISEGTALFKENGRISKLKHLSLSIRGFDFEAFLFSEAAGLELESLHADTTSFKDGHIFEEVSSHFSAVIKGDEKRVKIKRIVIYQPLSDSGRCKE